MENLFGVTVDNNTIRQRKHDHFAACLSASLMSTNLRESNLSRILTSPLGGKTFLES